MQALSKRSQLITRVIDIVFTSKRSLPAHYNTSPSRMQTFDVEFPIPEEDEHELASEAYYSAPGYLDDREKEIIDKTHFSMVLKIGEDVMIGSYIAARFELVLTEQEFIESIIARNIYLWNSRTPDTGLGKILSRKKIRDYFFHCLHFGYDYAYADIESEIASAAD